MKEEENIFKAKRDTVISGDLSTKLKVLSTCKT